MTVGLTALSINPVRMPKSQGNPKAVAHKMPITIEFAMNGKVAKKIEM